MASFSLKQKTQPIVMTPLHSFPTAAAARLNWHLTANTLPDALTRFLTALVEKKEILVDEILQQCVCGRGGGLCLQEPEGATPKTAM